MLNRLGIAIIGICSSTTWWPASWNALNRGSPCCRYCSLITRTRGHNKAAYRNAGVTGLSCCILRSVFSKADKINEWKRFESSLWSLSSLAVVGNSGENKPYSSISWKVFLPLPDKNNFNTSSNSRGAEICFYIGASWVMGFAVVVSSEKSNFAWKRIARSILTGSST